MNKWIPLLFLLAPVAAPAFAVCAVANTGPAIISWGAVTQDTNGNPLPGPVTYNIYMGAQGVAAKPLLISGLSALTYTVPGLAPGSYYFNMTAVVNGMPPSAMSAEGCKTILAAPPTTPVMTVAKNVFQRHSGNLVQVGTIALGVTCGADCGCKSPFSGAELFNVPRNRVKFAPHKDNGTQTYGVCA